MGETRIFRLARDCYSTRPPTLDLAEVENWSPEAAPTERFNFWNEIISNPLQPSCDTTPHWRVCDIISCS